MSARRQLLSSFGLALLAFALGAGAEPRGLEHAPESLRSWIESLPEAQQRAALRRLDDMPEQRRSRIFERWQALGEDERRQFEERLKGRLERAEHSRSRLDELSPESREKLAPLLRRWHDMAPAERRRMRRRLEHFRTLAPADQQALIDRRFAAKSPEERERILEALREAARSLPPRPPLGAPPEAVESAPEP